MFNFSDNITRLRHKRGITQERLANFVGVTKASVSKWETGQSIPDVLILSRIAAFFDITIDEMLGYQPQLTKEQIEKLYVELSADFTNKPFDEVMNKSRELVRQYYSCYTFLLQIACLWLNHFMITENKSTGMDVLESASKLCRHIIDNCKEIGVCNDAVILNATIALYMGNAKETADALEEPLNPLRFSRNCECTLVEAYQMLGETEKAKDYSQISMYMHVSSLVGMAVEHLALYADDAEMCENTINRIEKLSVVYDLEKLNPSNIIVFWLQAAIVYAGLGDRQRMLLMLERYVRLMNELINEEKVTLHGDDYFDRLDAWVEKTELRGNAPRDMKVIFESFLSAFAHPAFQAYAEDEDFIKIMEKLKGKGEKYE